MPESPSKCGRKEAACGKKKAARRRLRTQKPIFPTRRRSTGNSRRRRDPQNSHAATIIKLPKMTASVRNASCRSYSDPCAHSHFTSRETFRAIGSRRPNGNLSGGPPNHQPQRLKKALRYDHFGIGADCDERRNGNGVAEKARGEWQRGRRNRRRRAAMRIGRSARGHSNIPTDSQERACVAELFLGKGYAIARV
jgi:hypothetical protein